jgi:hypothetical protein
MEKYGKDQKSYQSSELKSKENKDLIDRTFKNLSEKNPQEIGANRASPFSVYITNQYCKEYGISFEKDLYNLNAQGLRSEEFTATHEGRHILFAGCSVAFGEGIPLEYSWAHKVYSEISNTEKTSGYFNVAQTGASSNFIIIQVLKYIEKYGVPDSLFVMLPDAQREHGYSENPELTQTLTANLYQLMYDRIVNKGGDVITCTWDDRINDGYMGKDLALETDARKAIPGLYKFDTVKHKHKHMFDYDKDYQRVGHWIENHILHAMDDGHPGTAEHDFYYNFMYGVYKKITEDKS